jgi:hypothetical protein
MQLAIKFDDLYLELRTKTGFNFGGGNPDDRVSITLGAFISAIIPYLFTTAGIILLLYLLMGGFGYLTSAGDPKKTQEAKAKITNALIGFLIVFAAYWIVQLAGKLLGIEAIQQTFQ